jgi:hypothetical protein
MESKVAKDMSDSSETLRRSQTGNIDLTTSTTLSDGSEADHNENEVLDFSAHVSKLDVTSEPPSYTDLHTQYDNIHGCIQISKVAKLITQHKYFQRLKEIHQLGPLHFKFPYADHSRFEHSIGVAYLARSAATYLRG